MSRTFRAFQEGSDKGPKRPRKNLRNNAREAYRHFTDEGYEDDYRPSKPGFYKKPGRGASGESSN